MGSKCAPITLRFVNVAFSGGLVVLEGVCELQEGLKRFGVIRKCLKLVGRF